MKISLAVEMNGDDEKVVNLIEISEFIIVRENPLIRRRDYYN